MHPHALLRMFLVVTVAFIACLAVSGCGKQQKVAPAKMPQVSKEPSAAAVDTADIFKEFYSEDSTKKKAGGKSKKQETFSPSSSSSSVQTEFSPQGRYTVQITCVRSRSFADGMSGKMKDKGYPAYVAEVQNPTPNLSGTFYRVRIGGFNALSAAKSFGEDVLVPGGYEYWVDKKSNDNVGMEGYGLGSGSAGSSAATSYDNAPAAGSTSSYQPAAPAAASSSSYETSNSTYSSPSSSSSSSNANSATSSGTTSSAYQSSTTAAGSGASSPASSSTKSSTPAASSTPSSTPSGSTTGTTGSTTGKASTGSSTESGWGTDSTSKSGW